MPLDPNKPQSIISSQHKKEHKQQHDELISILHRILFECNNIVMNKQQKVMKIDVLFSWISKNLYLFNTSNELLRVTKQKIQEFDRDDLGKTISDKYKWMLHLQHPIGKYSSFGRKINPSNRV